MRMYRYLGLLALVFVLGLSAQAELWMPSIFSSHMVLQQKQKNPIWGKADPGAVLSIQFGDQSQEVSVGADGHWTAILKSKSAGNTAYDLRVSLGAESLYFDDILIGEVWVASGQSNMQWTVSNSNDPEKEIAAANYPNLRLFYVTRVTADTPQEDCGGTWQACTSETVPGFSAVAYFYGRELHKKLNVPVGLIHTSWGGTPSESWTSQETVEKVPAFAPISTRWEDIVAKWPESKVAYEATVAEWQKKKDAGETKANKPRMPYNPDHPHRISSLYNGMIAPIVPYGIKGAIWYQGESNANRAFQYRTIFPAMIEDWRMHWNQGDFPFYFVQLANYKARSEEPTPDCDWAELREAQTMTLDLRNTGMASAIDIGVADDIHPRNKQDVGKRLARWALNKDYGMRDVVASGPLYTSHSIDGDKVTISFDYAKGLHGKAGELAGFMIAGEDQQFVWADVEVKGKKIVVSSASVPAPKAVRYGWANNPVSTLYNEAGLPASPFRTDDWPGVTVDAK